MKEGQPTYDQLCKIIGSIYADAFLRIEFLENENKTLRQDQQATVASLQAFTDSIREERDKLQAEKDADKWNNGNGNSMLPESLLEKLESKSTERRLPSFPPRGNS